MSVPTCGGAPSRGLRRPARPGGQKVDDDLIDDLVTLASFFAVSRLYLRDMHSLLAFGKTSRQAQSHLALSVPEEQRSETASRTFAKPLERRRTHRRIACSICGIQTERWDTMTNPYG